MYKSTTNPKYYIPDLHKYECKCGKQFILSDGYNNTNVSCPYCQSVFVNSIVTLEDADILGDLGCIAIGFLKDELKKEII